MRKNEMDVCRILCAFDNSGSIFLSRCFMVICGKQWLLDLDAEPDYLLGHLACMEIDSEYGVECGGING